MIRKQKTGREGSEKMKMGNLNEEAWMNAAEARLIGALIGLARATDGNTVRTADAGGTGGADARGTERVL